MSNHEIKVFYTLPLSPVVLVYQAPVLRDSMYRANMYRYTFCPVPSRVKGYRGTGCIAN